MQNNIYKLGIEARLTRLETKMDEILENHLPHLESKLDKLLWFLVTIMAGVIIDLLLQVLRLKSG